MVTDVYHAMYRQQLNDEHDTPTPAKVTGQPARRVVCVISRADDKTLVRQTMVVRATLATLVKRSYPAPMAEADANAPAFVRTYNSLGMQ